MCCLNKKMACLPDQDLIRKKKKVQFPGGKNLNLLWVLDLSDMKGSFSWSEYVPVCQQEDSDKKNKLLLPGHQLGCCHYHQFASWHRRDN